MKSGTPLAVLKENGAVKTDGEAASYIFAITLGAAGKGIGDWLGGLTGAK